MSTSSSITGLPLPANEDVLNAQATFGNYANAADTYLAPRFATTSARDTAFAGAAVAGQLSVITNNGTFGELMVFNGTEWQYVPVPQHGRKTVAQAFTSNVTLAALSGMSVTVRPFAVYEYYCFAVWSGAANVGAQLDVTIPAGATLVRKSTGLTRTAGSSGNMTIIAAANNVPILYGTGSGPTLRDTAIETGILSCGANGGTLQVRGAQAFSNASATTFQPNSFVVVTRIQ